MLVNQALIIKANGHGSRQSCRTDKYGFPRSLVPRNKIFFGFQTGDIVVGNVPKGKHFGIHKGRVAIRSKGSFNISTSYGLVEGVKHEFCQTIHKKDGYSYTFTGSVAAQDKAKPS